MDADAAEVPIPGGNKPGKPDEDLVAYIRQLEIPLTEAAATFREAGHIGEDQQLLVTSIYKEIQKREASLATHKLCSQIVDNLLSVSSAQQTLGFLRACTPYTLFLATNRYASHVLEGVIANIHAFLIGKRAIASETDGTDEDNSEFASNVVDAIAEMCEYVDKSLGDLMFDTCGTHIVRALVLLLAGREPQPHKQGAHKGEMYAEGMHATSERKKIHGKSVALATAAVSLPSASDIAGLSTKFYAGLPENAAKKLKTWLVTLCHRLGECQTQSTADTVTATADAAIVSAAESNILGVACDPNASPTAQLLLDACTVSAPASAKYLCRKFIGVGCSDLQSDELSGQVDIQASQQIAGKKRKRARDATPVPVELDGTAVEEYLSVLCFHNIGSHLVESLLLHADKPLFDALVSSFFTAKLADLLTHPTGNFIVQRLLVSCRSIEQTEELVNALLPSIPRLAAARMDGVVWHMAAACVGGEVIQRLAALHGSPKPGGAAGKLPIVPVFAGVAEGVSAELQQRFVNALVLSAMHGDKAEKYINKDKTPEWRAKDPHFIRWWLDINGYRSATPTINESPAVNSTDKAAKKAASDTALPQLVLSAGGERVIATLMHFPPQMTAPIVETLCCLPAQELGGVASAPFSSRHVLEVLAGRGPEVHAQLHAAFRGLYCALAQTRFGCWVVTKLFTAYDIKRKTQVASELAEHERALSGSASGKQVLKAVRLEHYVRNAESWTASWARAATKMDFLEDIIPTASKPSKATGSDVPADAPRKSKKQRSDAGAGVVATASDVKLPGGSKVDAAMATLGFSR